jgi:hypothetical protein
VYAAVISVVGVIATLAASVRPDVEGAGRLHVLAAIRGIEVDTIEDPANL